MQSNNTNVQQLRLINCELTFSTLLSLTPSTFRKWFNKYEDILKDEFDPISMSCTRNCQTLNNIVLNCLTFLQNNLITLLGIKKIKNHVYMYIYVYYKMHMH